VSKLMLLYRGMCVSICTFVLVQQVNSACAISASVEYCTFVLVKQGSGIRIFVLVKQAIKLSTKSPR
jgi:hypothetical protein